LNQWIFDYYVFPFFLPVDFSLLRAYKSKLFKDLLKVREAKGQNIFDLSRSSQYLVTLKGKKKNEHLRTNQMAWYLKILFYVIDK